MESKSSKKAIGTSLDADWLDKQLDTGPGSGPENNTGTADPEEISAEEVEVTV